jgi:diacylglycerol kinase family enzyme
VSGDRLICHLDGEPYATQGTVTVSVEPGALQVAAPAGA